MKSPHSESKGVLIAITHCVNPHQFYFKYVEGINPEYSKFDYEIQVYGNELFHQKIYKNGYVPSENELVIFFHIIFNKWVRGQVVSVGQEITLWCVDNGISQTCSPTQILPLDSRFHEDTNLVHLGGLSLLPTEKVLNKQYEVETQISDQWEHKTINCFKEIVNTSKTFLFSEEFHLSNHKFGVLAFKTKIVNNILLEMNNVAHHHQYSEDDLRFYVCKDRLEISLQESLRNGSTIQAEKVNKNSIPYNSLHRLSVNSDSKVSSIEDLENSNVQENFDDSVSQRSSNASTAPDSDTKPSRSSTIHPIAQELEACEITNVLSDSLTEIEVNVSLPDVQIQCNDDFDLALSSSPNTLSKPSAITRLPKEYECFLRSYKICTKKIRKPKDSTLNWWRSANKRNTAKNVNDSSQSEASPPAVPSTSNISRRKMLANLNSTNSTAKPATIVNNNKFFGIPAGYAKASLDTFGGLTFKT